jgi:hypothetical protein
MATPARPLLSSSIVVGSGIALWPKETLSKTKVEVGLLDVMRIEVMGAEDVTPKNCTVKGRVPLEIMEKVSLVEVVKLIIRGSKPPARLKSIPTAVIPPGKVIIISVVPFEASVEVGRYTLGPATIRLPITPLKLTPNRVSPGGVGIGMN